jgi:CRP/FNR family transcriptional regulator, cyclic AMP receptor protein
MSAAFDIFQWLPPAVADEFIAATSLRRYRRGEQIYNEGDPGDSMFRVATGAVRLSTTRIDGRQFLYLLFEPGDCFGESSCIDGGPRPHVAEAAEDTTVQLLHKAAFLRICEKHREFDNAIMRLLAGHMRLLSAFLADAHLSDLSARVAGRILSLARSFGVSGADDVQLSIRITQGDLALMVGGARQSVNRIMQTLDDDGIVSMRAGRLTVHNMAALRLRACGGDETVT